MRSLYSVGLAAGFAAFMAVASLTPAPAQALHASMPAPLSLHAIEAGNLLLIIFVCCRLIMLRRQPATTNGS